MAPALESQLQRLAEANIRLVPADLSSHYVLERDGFVCLVEKRGEAFGAIGSVCKLLDDGGFAVVTWTGTEAWFAAKGSLRVPATDEEVLCFRSFATDLKSALREVQRQ